jgi:hypothetical protein
MNTIVIGLIVLTMVISNTMKTKTHSEECRVANRGCERRGVTFEPPPNKPRPHCKKRSCAGGGSFTNVSKSI